MIAALASRAPARAFMKRAIEQMRLSEGRRPLVGTVIEKDGLVLAEAHRQLRLHAERAAIEVAQSQGLDLRGATVYTTLEPCVEADGSTTECCADLIIRMMCTTVYIGRYDHNPRIYREGWKRLRDGGIVLRDFEPDLRSQIDRVNMEFQGHFQCGAGPHGGARFDYLLNEGNFEIQLSPTDKRVILTRWARCGVNSIYACAIQPVRVALARYARDFEEIDDPRALDFNYTIRVGTGEIAAFVSDFGCALVKVLEVESGAEYGALRTSVKIQFETRVWE